MKSIVEFLDYLKYAFSRWQEHGMMKEGAALAFYAVFSLAPLLFILSETAALIFGIHTIGTGAAQGVGKLAGASGGDLVQSMIGNSYHASSDPVLGIIGVIVLIFGASNFFIQISDSFDIIAGLPAEKFTWINFFKDRAKAFLLIVLAGILIGVFLLTTAGIAAFSNFLAVHFTIPLWFLLFLNFTLSFVVATLLFALLYRYLPTQHLSWRHAIIGALVTAAFLVIGEYVLGWIFSEGLIGSYGLAGAVIAFLTWIYYSSLLFLFGAEVSYVYSAPPVKNPAIA